MRWLKHGLVWRTDGSCAWARSHATCPTPIELDDGTIRVYVQCRDAHNVGRIGFVDLDPGDPRKVIRESRVPVLDVGEPGAFDDNGVFPTSVVKLPDGRLYLYYVGFELCHHIRYRLLTGLAVSEDGGRTFLRERTVPVIERSAAEPHFRCGTFVRLQQGRYQMWYVAGGSWETLGGKALPVYDIRYGESADGVSWADEGKVVLAVDLRVEHGFGRPYVIERSDGYHMHYSIRKRDPARYRMGLATSPDGLAWCRRDEKLGIDVSDSPWEDDSVEFGAEIKAAGKTWLLYNGNDFGRDGFCIAERLDA